MQNRVVVCGAIAFDEVASTAAYFSRSGTPPTVHPPLNCKLHDLDQHVGGCAANICFNLTLLGVPNHVIAVTGRLDDEPLLATLTSNTSAHLLRIANSRSARAMIVTDPAGAQFTGFFSGPTITDEQWRAHVLKTDWRDGSVLVQAALPPAQTHAALSSAGNMPACRIWSPGQFADQFTAAQVQDCLAHLQPASDLIIGNRHEIDFLCDLVDLNHFTVIATNGSDPVRCMRSGHTVLTVDVASVAGAQQVDPTGCGDAFVAGIVAGIVHAMQQRCSQGKFTLPDDGDIGTAVHLGIELAQACLAQRGSQSHTFTLSQS